MAGANRGGNWRSLDSGDNRGAVYGSHVTRDRNVANGERARGFEQRSLVFTNSHHNGGGDVRPGRYDAPDSRSRGGYPDNGYGSGFRDPPPSTYANGRGRGFEPRREESRVRETAARHESHFDQPYNHTGSRGNDSRGRDYSSHKRDSGYAQQGDGRGGGGRGSGDDRRGGSASFAKRQKNPAGLYSGIQPGSSVHLVTNAFRLLEIPSTVFQHYDVKMDPELEHPGLRTALIMQYENVFGCNSVFTGKSLFAPVLLPTPAVFMAKTHQAEEVKITLHFVREVLPNDPEILHLLNSRMKRNLHAIGTTRIQDKHYCMDQARNLQGFPGVQLVPGFVTPIGNFQQGPMMKVEAVHKIVRNDTAMNVIGHVMSNSRSGDKKTEIAKELVGKSVLTTFSNDTYQIQDVDYTKCPNDTFVLRKENREISFADYFEQKHGHPIKDRNQPMLVAKPPKNSRQKAGESVILLPPELCQMTGMSSQMQNDRNFTQVRARQTNPPPDKRVEDCYNLRDRLASNLKVVESLATLGVKFAPKLAQLNGRMLDRGAIVFGEDNLCEVDESVDWTMVARFVKYYRPVIIESWIVVFPHRHQGLANSFVSQCVDLMNRAGCHVSRPEMMAIGGDRPNDYQRALNQLRNDLQLVVVFFPRKDEMIYQLVKRILCLERPVTSQVISASGPIGKGARGSANLSVVTKLAAQICTKLDGAPWAVSLPRTDYDNTMIIGYEVYRDSSNRGVTVGAFVAAFPPDFTRYVARSESQPSRDNILTNISVQLTAIFRKYKEEVGRDPDRVIIYRSGGGNVRTLAIRETEIVEIKKIMTEICLKPPKMLFLLINETSYTRFMTESNGLYGNPPAGVVIDEGVTRPGANDFFLITQKETKGGCIAPTHFDILVNETGFEKEQVQELTNRMCYLYYNWTGSIRMPSVNKYAHKLAELQGNVLHKPPAIELLDGLTFI